MAEELKMDMWHDRKELKRIYKRDRNQVTTVQPIILMSTEVFTLSLNLKK